MHPYLVTVLAWDSRGWAIGCVTESDALGYAQSVMMTDRKVNTVVVMKLAEGRVYHQLRRFERNNKA
jgi:hypothetical protein